MVVSVVIVMGFAAMLFARTEPPFFDHGWLCWSGSAVPREVSLNGPFAIGTDWTEIQVDGALKSSPHVQEIVLMANHNRYESDSNVVSMANRYHEVAGGFKDRLTGDYTSFDVQIVDERGRSVRLIQNMVGTDSSTNETFAVLGFSLAHDDWPKRYFLPDFKGKIIAVRSSKPFVLASIKWSTPHRYRNPCKAWEDVSPLEIFAFEEDSPPSRYPDAELPLNKKAPPIRWGEGNSK